MEEKMDARDELIAEQQLEIRKLKIGNTEYKKNLNQINMMMYCCGPGPFNDNSLQFNQKHLRYLKQIANLSEVSEDCDG
jgi:hypothetical protein